MSVGVSKSCCCLLAKRLAPAKLHSFSPQKVRQYRGAEQCIADLTSMADAPVVPKIIEAPPISDINVVAGPEFKWEKGQLYVIEFFEATSPASKNVVPFLSSLASKYEDATFLAITSEDASAARDFARTLDPQQIYTIAVDPTGNLKKRYFELVKTPISAPYCFLVSKDGHLHWHGPPGGSALEEELLINIARAATAEHKSLNAEQLHKMRVHELKGVAAERGIAIGDLLEKEDLIQKILSASNKA